MVKSTNINSGFTLVELLTTIIIISILATITVVVYNGMQERSKRAAIQTDMNNFAAKIELARLQSSDKLYSTVPTSDTDIHATKDVYATGRNNWYYCVSTDRSKFAIGVVLTGTKGYFQSSTYGLEEATVVADSTTCSKAGGVAGTSQLGYSQVGGVWTWASWVKD